MSKHPNNGPTFSKSTLKPQRPSPSSPGRREAILEQSKRDAIKTKEFTTDPASWVRKYVLKNDR